MTTKRPTNVVELRASLERFRSDESLARALSMAVRPSDVFIATYPKCGTTWTQQIVHSLRARGAMDFAEITEVVPWFELAHDMGLDPGAPQRADPRAFKTHLDQDELPAGGRYLHVTRHPEDVLRSLFRFFDGWFMESGSIDLPTFAAEIMLGGTKSGKYWDHVVSWWPHRHRDDVLFLCYEDMRDDLADTIERIASFIGCPLDAVLRDVVCQRASLAFMREHAEQFDDHVVRAFTDVRCGLPPGGAGGGKVRADGDTRLELDDATTRALDERWAEEIEATLGFASYEELRAALHG